jgi:hypothetical protein
MVNTVGIVFRAIVEELDIVHCIEVYSKCLNVRHT